MSYDRSALVDKVVSNDNHPESIYGRVIEVRGFYLIIKTTEDIYVSMSLAQFTPDSSWKLEDVSEEVAELDEEYDEGEGEMEQPDINGNSRQKIMAVLREAYPRALSQREISEACGWDYKSNGNKRIGARIAQINSEMERIQVLPHHILHYLWIAG